MIAYTNFLFGEDTDVPFDFILGLTFEWQPTQRQGYHIARARGSYLGDQIHSALQADDLD